MNVRTSTRLPPSVEGHCVNIRRREGTIVIPTLYAEICYGFAAESLLYVLHKNVYDDKNNSSAVAHLRSYGFFFFYG